MNGKIVWILGAGFSKSLGAPLLSDLFSMGQLDRALIHYEDIFKPDESALQNIVRLFIRGAHGIGKKLLFKINGRTPRLFWSVWTSRLLALRSASVWTGFARLCMLTLFTTESALI